MLQNTQTEPKTELVAEAQLTSQVNMILTQTNWANCCLRVRATCIIRIVTCGMWHAPAATALRSPLFSLSLSRDKCSVERITQKCLNCNQSKLKST